MKDKFLYKTTFDSILYASDNIDKLNYQSSASLESLKEMLPYDIDLTKNIDLIPVAFDAAVINEFNKNDDGISASTANNIKRYFIHKPTNIEHDRSRIIGHITNAAFTERNTHKYIYGEDAARMSEPFNLSLGGIVYKLIDEEFTEILRDSLHNGSKGTTIISASWELGFNTFGIAIGGKKLKDCKAVTDPIKVAALAPHLRCFGGDGYSPDGERIYRLIIGEVYPLGIGFTEKPAADVKGIYVDDPFNAYADKVVPAKEQVKESVVISQSENLNVKTHNKKPNKLMDFIEQIKAALEDFEVDKISNEAKAGLTKDIVDAVKEANKEYLAEKQMAEQAKANAEKELADLRASFEQVKKDLTEAKEKIQGFEQAAETEAIAASRDKRMEEIDATFELDDEDRKLVLADLQDFDPRDDEKFDAYASRLKILWKDKDKEAIAQREKDIQNQVLAKVQEELDKLQTSQASENGDDDDDDGRKIEDVTASAKKDDETAVANKSTAAATEQTLQEKYQAFFKEEDIKVTF